MFDHLGIVVSDLNRSRTFYTNLLAALDIQLLQDNSQDDGTGWLLYGTEDNAPFFVVASGRPSFWTEKHAPAMSPVHCAFIAASEEAVKLFYGQGLAYGGSDNGAPGDRGRGYYAAYLIDPDGNNVEAGYRKVAS